MFISFFHILKIIDFGFEKLVNDLRHNCGFCVAYSLHDAYKMVRNLQHRGRDAVGVACIGPNRIDVIKWAGEANRFDLDDLQDLFPAHMYHTYMGHVRYATRGRKDKILQDAHPHVMGGRVETHEGFVVIRNCDAAVVHNGQVDTKYLNGFDPGCLTSGCDSEAILYRYKDILERQFIREVPGAFSMAIADKERKDVMVMRDMFGVRPAAIGRKDGKYVIASEDRAIDKIGGDFVANLEPGAISYMTPEGNIRIDQVVQSPGLSHCFFEWNYLAHKKSTMDDLFVDLLRRNLGRRCAQEFPFVHERAVVTYLPRCPKPAAEAYAHALGLPLIPAFLKMRGERSFLGATQEDRNISIKKNLYLNSTYAHMLKGAFVIVLEDSTIRGTNSARAAQLLEEAGAEYSTLINYTDMIGIFNESGGLSGCTEGVDMPPSDNFIARDTEGNRNRTWDEISELVGIDVCYLKAEAMLEEYAKLGMDPNNLCTKCIGGPDPFEKFSKG